LALYIFYFSIICVWSVLGAVLNPEKFLPIATGTLAIAVTGFLIYSKLSNIDKTLKELVGSLVDGQLKVTMMETIGKQNSGLAKALDNIGSIPEIMFNRAINTYMTLNNQPKIERALTDKIMEGNAGAMASLLHIIILDSVHKLSEQLGLEPSLNVMIAEIVLDEFNPEAPDKEKIRASVVKNAKKLIQHLFPSFSCDILDDLLHIAIKMNPESFKPLCKSLKIPTDVIDMTIGFISNNRSLLTHSFKGVLYKLVSKQSYRFYDHFKKLENLTLESDTVQAAKILGVHDQQDYFDLMLARHNDDSGYTGYVLINIIKKHEKRHKDVDFKNLKFSLLALNSLASD